MIKQLLLPAFTLFSFLGFTQTELPKNWDEERGKKGIRIVFYNVENLFDTINNPNKRDEEYLPTAEKKWNSYKYQTKLNRISKVIVAAGGWELPDIIGVCEIENDTVLRDLTQTRALEKMKYQVVHYSSPDARGIDVGLMYNRKKLKLIASAPLTVKLEEDANFKTRDILYSKFYTLKDTLHIYINHWPSRRGGQQASEHKRIKAATVLKSHLDSIKTFQPNAYFVIMGDFNDAPTNASINRILNTGTYEEETYLVNLMTYLPSSSGTHKYRGHWDYLDQFIVSPYVFDKNSRLKLNEFKAFVLQLDWLLVKDSKYPGYYPNRNWKGSFFSDGFSDHLPIVMDIVIR